MSGVFTKIPQRRQLSNARYSHRTTSVRPVTFVVDWSSPVQKSDDSTDLRAEVTDDGESDESQFLPSPVPKVSQRRPRISTVQEEEEISTADKYPPEKPQAKRDALVSRRSSPRKTVKQNADRTRLSHGNRASVELHLEKVIARNETGKPVGVESDTECDTEKENSSKIRQGEIHRQLGQGKDNNDLTAKPNQSNSINIKDDSDQSILEKDEIDSQDTAESLDSEPEADSSADDDNTEESREGNPKIEIQEYESQNLSDESVDENEQSELSQSDQEEREVEENIEVPIAENESPNPVNESVAINEQLELSDSDGEHGESVTGGKYTVDRSTEQDEDSASSKESLSEEYENEIQQIARNGKPPRPVPSQNKGNTTHKNRSEVVTTEQTSPRRSPRKSSRIHDTITHMNKKKRISHLTSKNNENSVCSNISTDKTAPQKQNTLDRFMTKEKVSSKRTSLRNIENVTPSKQKKLVQPDKLQPVENLKVKQLRSSHVHPSPGNLNVQKVSVSKKPVIVSSKTSQRALRSTIDTSEGTQSDTAHEVSFSYVQSPKPKQKVVPTKKAVIRKGAENSSGKDKDVEDSQSSTSRSLYMWDGSRRGKKRTAANALDLDIVLNEVEELTAEYRESISNVVKRKAVKEFFNIFQDEMTEVIDFVEEKQHRTRSFNKKMRDLKTLQSDLSDARKETSRCQLDLYNLQCEIKEKNPARRAKASLNKAKEMLDKYRQAVRCKNGSAR